MDPEYNSDYAKLRLEANIKSYNEREKKDAVDLSAYNVSTILFSNIWKTYNLYRQLIIE